MTTRASAACCAGGCGTTGSPSGRRPAAGGREAVEIYRSHSSTIDVVLLDVRMPGRDGPETLAALRELDPHLRFCFMTGESGRYSDQDLLGLGALAVFHKPFTPGELVGPLTMITTPTDPFEDLQEGRWVDGAPAGGIS